MLKEFNFEQIIFGLNTNLWIMKSFRELFTQQGWQHVLFEIEKLGSVILETGSTPNWKRLANHIAKWIQLVLEAAQAPFKNDIVVWPIWKICLNINS